MTKKVVFISLPMSGLSDEVIKSNIEAAKAVYLSITKLDISQVAFVTNFNCSEPDDTVDPYRRPIWYLGVALKRISKCDEVFFWFGWQKARGCQVEHDVCVQYNIPIIAVDAIGWTNI